MASEWRTKWQETRIHRAALLVQGTVMAAVQDRTEVDRTEADRTLLAPIELDRTAQVLIKLDRTRLLIRHPMHLVRIPLVQTTISNTRTGKKITA